MMIEDEQLRNLYQISSSEHLQKLESGLLHLQQYPNDNILWEFWQSIHSLKIDSRSANVKTVEVLSDQIEEIIGQIQLQVIPLSTEVSDRLFIGLNAIKLLVLEALTGTPSGVDTNQIIDDLKAVVFTSTQPVFEFVDNNTIIKLPPTYIKDEQLPLTPTYIEDEQLPLAPTYIEDEQLPLTPTYIEDEQLSLAPTYIEDEQLRNLYQISTTEHLQKLEAGLLHLQQYPNDNILWELWHSIHSLQIDSRSVGVETVEVLSELLEEIIGQIQRQEIILSTEVSDRLFIGLNAIKLLVLEALTGTPSGVDTNQIIDDLKAVVFTSTQPVFEFVDNNTIIKLPPTYIKDEQLPLTPTYIEDEQLPLVLSYIEDEQLRNLYQISTTEHLQKLEAGLLHLQQYPNDNILWELWHSIHSLQIDSRSVGVETVEVLSELLEEIIGQIQRQEIILSTEVSDRLFIGLNAIKLLVLEALTGTPSGVDTNQIIDDLKAVVFTSTQPVFEFVDNNTIIKLAPTYIEDEEQRNLYQISTTEHLQTLEAGLLQLQQYPDEDILRELQRSIHSLKGDSRSVGVETVEVLSELLEEIIGQIQLQVIPLSIEVSDRLFIGLNAINLLVLEALTGTPSGVDTNQIIDDLKAVVFTSTQPVFEFVDNNTIIKLAPTYIEDEEQRNLYQISTTEHLQTLEAGLLQLQQYPDEDILRELQRSIHSLKGDSRSVGVETVEVLSELLEEIIGQIQLQVIPLSTEVSDRLFMGLNAINLLVLEALNGEPSGVDTNQIIDDLKAVVFTSTQPVFEFVDNNTIIKLAPTYIEDEELRNLYQISTTEHLQTLEAGLLQLQQYPDEDILRELQRSIHSLKGDSRSVGVETVEVLSELLEEIIGQIQRQEIILSTEVSDRLFIGLNAINLLVLEALNGEPSGVDTNQIIDDLKAVVFTSTQPVFEFVDNNTIRKLAPTYIEDEELRNLYQISTTEHLQTLEAGLLQLQQYPDEDILRELQRSIHSLKGDSRSVGVETVEVLSELLEEIIGQIQLQVIPLSTEVSDRLFMGLNAINLLVLEALTGTPSGVDTNQIIDDLKAVVFTSTQPVFEFVDNNTIRKLAPTYIEDEELRNLYQISTTEHLQTLEAGLLQLQQYPDEDILRELQRSIHSLKGDSRSVGVETVEVLSELLEEIIGQIQLQVIPLSTEVSDHLFMGLNAIKILVLEALTGTPSGVDTNQIIDDLKAAVRESQQPILEVVDNNTLPKIEEELQNVYKITSQERLQKLEAGLLHLEKHPNDAVTLEELLREAHSLKGDSRSVGLETVESLIHQVEDTLSGIKHQQITLTHDVSDCLFLELDSISTLIQEAMINQPSEVDTVNKLNHFIEAVIPTTEESQRINQELPSSSQEISEPYHIDTIRVETRHLDALMTDAEELTVTKIAVAHGMAEIEELVTLWEESKTFYKRGRSLGSSSMVNNPLLERLEKIIYSLRSSAQENSTKLDIITGELREKIRTLRLLPLSTIFQLFPRVVRDLARLQSKEVELIIEGGETNADKSILEEIKDCLMHMIRNAIDHGIETSTERERLGKPRIAKIWVRSYQTANNIIIEVADDGRGLDIETIKQTAIKRQLYTPQELAAMTLNQIYSLIFSPGFSTRTLITEISGRGIGLDVVRTNVERLKGSIQIESTPGEGSTFRIQLSPNLTTVKALLVEVQGIAHALPIEFVRTSLLISENEISTTTEGTTITFEGEDISVASLADLLELSNREHNTDSTNKRQKSNLQFCVLLKVGLEQAGILVDRLLDTQELVIKPQSKLLKRVRNVMGATILPTGDVCMILNPPDLLHSLQKQIVSFISIKSKEIKRKPVILLVEDSLPVRTQEKRLLERAGYEVVIAVDGLDGYNKLKTRDIDAVLTDVEMPNLDGFSLTAKIRQHPEYRNLPIIIVTTLASEEDKKRGANVGADAYIVKGKFNENALLEILEKLVSKL